MLLGSECCYTMAGFRPRYFFAIRNEIIMKKTIPAIIISTMLFTGGCAFTAAPPADEPEVQEVTVNSVTDEEDPACAFNVRQHVLRDPLSVECLG